MPITVQNLVQDLLRLRRDVEYNYPNPRTTTRVVIHDIHLPNGPIFVKRFDPAEGETVEDARIDTISSKMLVRLAPALQRGVPINFDRLFGASYNTRSTLEALLAQLPNFWMCYPGRIEMEGDRPVQKKGHKHIIMLDDVHPIGEFRWREVDMVISESMIPQSVVYEAVQIPAGVVDADIDIDIARRHAQIQIALLKIGNQIGLRTFIAQNDQGIVYEGSPLREHEGILTSLATPQLMHSFTKAQHAGRLIDAIWFRGEMRIPAVMEVEHSTGITSGLNRMLGFKNNLPDLAGMRYVIVAEEADRDRAIREANLPQFRELNAKFMSYGAVEELYSLCSRRGITGVEDQFLDAFMEELIF